MPINASIRPGLLTPKCKSPNLISLDCISIEPLICIPVIISHLGIEGAHKHVADAADAVEIV